jgi:Glycosyl hydrolases family 2, sugar binding domain/Glycosyl hydrolases family 2, TIM barrel domain/Glycosyl hydrolases family 2
MRKTFSLDGTWAFNHSSDGAWRSASVPLPWQAQFADLRHASGRAIYKRNFQVPADWKGSEIYVQFGAVSYVCDVSVNGHKLGSHEGGYLPFEVILPQGVLRSENVIEVSVLLPDGDGSTSEEFPFAEIPHGKQSWYGPIGGIWQSVSLAARHAAHVGQCAINSNLSSGFVQLTVSLPAAAVGASIAVKLKSPDKTLVATATAIAINKQCEISLNVENPLPWSPDEPNLYNAELALQVGGENVDITNHTFGFRSIETKGGQVLLNGKAFYMRAALDQDYYADGICTPPSIAFLEDQFRKAKALGLNLLRCHIKVPDPRYYEVADRVGMLVWTEIPNVASFTAASARRMRETMEGILRRDGNHPSIIIWTLINEDWGTRVVEDKSHRLWLAQAYDWLKQQDPTRLVVDNSACHNNFHVKTDLNDYHYYRSVPERRDEWDKLTAEFAAAADWTFSPHGDAQRITDEPLIVSEFGVWGLPNPKQILNADGGEAWWMETGGTWGEGVAYPHGIENRFASLQLQKVFGSFDAFIECVQWYQFYNLKYEIESMRAHSTIMGYVITELTDVHWEANGLLDMNRNPRIFHNRFAEINSDIVIVPKVQFYAGWAGAPFSFALSLATGGATLASGATLHVALPDGTEQVLKLSSTTPLAVLDLGAVHTKLPSLSESKMCNVNLRLMHRGNVLARNSFEIAVYAVRNTTALPSISTNNEHISNFAKTLGYKIMPQDKAHVHIVHALDESDIATLQHGARYVVLADGTVKTHKNLRTDANKREQPFMPIFDDVPGNIGGPESQLPNIVLHERHGTLWRGDWIASFSWLKRSGAFASLPGGPMFDLSFDKVVPYHVMTGFRNWEFGGAVQAGLVVGWAHKPAALIAERRVGKGAVLASTFRLLRNAPGEDPVAATLFDALIKTASQIKIEN